jgi:uncharacterized protein (TIGR02246 family)
MSNETEIKELEARLRVAELGPDPRFFEQVLADDAVIVGQDGTAELAKAKIVQAHQPGATPKFTRVEMSELKIVDHGVAAVVTCTGTFEGPRGTATLKFMRVWLKRDGRWQIVAASVAG